MSIHGWVPNAGYHVPGSSKQKREKDTRLTGTQRPRERSGKNGGDAGSGFNRATVRHGGGPAIWSGKLERMCYACAMRLFDDISRTDHSPCRPTESTYAFYNRSARPHFAAMRDLLEDWLGRLPAGMQPHIATDMRSGDNGKWYSAFWEIYLYTLLRGVGYEVTYEPPVPHGRRRPDFLIEGRGGAAYVEARVVVGDNSAEMRRAQVEEAIGEVYDPNFAVWVDWEDEHHQLPSLTTLKRELEAWLGSLDPREIEALLPVTSIKELPNFPWKNREWAIEFQPWLKPAGTRGVRGAFPTIAGSRVGMQLSRDRERIRKAILKKSRRYGLLEHPLIVAILCDSTLVHDDDIIDALFGFTGIQVTFSGDGAVEGTRDIRLPNGAWRGTKGAKGKRAAAMIIGRGLGPQNLTTAIPQLWLHPEPERELILPLPFPIKALEITDGQGKLVDRPEGLDIPINEALGVPPDWGTENPWADDDNDAE